MSKARLLIVALLVSTAIAGCASTPEDPPPPPPELPAPPPPPVPPPPPPPPVVQYTNIVSAGASAIHWTYETSLDGLTPGQRVAHMQRWHPNPIQLPATVNAWIGDQLFIVPVCNGTTRWDRGRIYPVNHDLTVRVSC